MQRPGRPDGHDERHCRTRAIRDVRRRRTRSARDFLAGLVDPIPAEADTVVLVVSELVTNALRRGGGSCTLDLTAHPDNIEVAMHDRSPQATSTMTRASPSRAHRRQRSPARLCSGHTRPPPPRHRRPGMDQPPPRRPPRMKRRGWAAHGRPGPGRTGPRSSLPWVPAPGQGPGDRDTCGARLSGRARRTDERLVSHSEHVIARTVAGRHRRPVCQVVRVGLTSFRVGGRGPGRTAHGSEPVLRGPRPCPGP